MIYGEKKFITKANIDIVPSLLRGVNRRYIIVEILVVINNDYIGLSKGTII